jgi:hypothetical protein
LVITTNSEDFLHPLPGLIQTHAREAVMSLTRREMRCSPADVFAVLEDGWLLGLWVVGASRIRRVDAAWPAPGSAVHHSVGIWPALLDDTTSVESWAPGQSIQLRARAWPAGEATVLIEVQPRVAGALVTMTEDAVKGPGLIFPKPLRSLGLHPRNTESLQRLAFLAENRERTR